MLFPIGMEGEVGSNATINSPDTKSELEALFQKYEDALVANDIEALRSFFWASPHAMRYGVTEELYGADEIAAFRKTRVVNFSSRTALRTTVLTIGDGFGVTALEFSVISNEQHKHGRQTQVWARLPEAGWKIISAHVSHRVEPGGIGRAYAAAAAALVGTPVAPDSLTVAGKDLETMAMLAAPLMAFDFPEECEPAPRFTP